MNIRDGLSASQLANFQSCVNQLPALLNGLEDSDNDSLMADNLTAEAVALAFLTFGSAVAASHYLHKPTSRLAGKTPLACIRDNETSRERVIGDLFRIIEGYVF